MENPVAVAEISAISIDQLKPNPWNRTVFDPQAMKDLVASLKVSGVKEPLIVRRFGEGEYQIASGHRRWLAAKEAGLKTVPCFIQALSDEQVAEDNITINIQRENIPPLELARMVNDYVTRFDLTQEKAAQTFGKTRTWANELVGFLPLSVLFPENVGVPTFLGWDQLRALKKGTPEVQKQVAKELAEGTLKPENVAKRCHQLQINGGKAHSTLHAPPAPIDPLATLWPDLQKNLELAPGTYWQAKYGVHKQESGKSINGCFFFVAPSDADSKADLAAWFLNMGQALAGKKVDQILPEAVHETQSAAQNLMQSMKPRLPENPQEQAEVEKLAVTGGPKAVYVWIYGANSPMTKMAPSSWAEVGEVNPSVGLKQILVGIKDFAGPK